MPSSRKSEFFNDKDLLRERVNTLRGAREMTTLITPLSASEEDKLQLKRLTCHAYLTWVQALEDIRLQRPDRDFPHIRYLSMT
jgi:hypothetical protein